jgi:hypothetical protein
MRTRYFLERVDRLSFYSPNKRTQTLVSYVCDLGRVKTLLSGRRSELAKVRCDGLAPTTPLLFGASRLTAGAAGSAGIARLR